MIDEQQAKKDMDELVEKLDQLTASTEKASRIADLLELEPEDNEDKTDGDTPEKIEQEFDSDLNNEVLDFAPKE